MGGHEVTRNLSEPSDQTIMHIDVYADYLSDISPQTTSRALMALLTRGGSKSVRVDNRYTEAYGPHEVMLNVDGINIYTKTMITCDEDLIGQIYVGKEELKVRSIGHCAMLEEDAMYIVGTEADVSAHMLDISGKKTQLRGLLDTGAFLSVIPIETWERMGFNKDDLTDSRIRLSAANKGKKPQRKKRQSTPLPLPRDAASTAPGGGGGQSKYEKWNSKYDGWSRRFHDSQ